MKHIMYQKHEFEMMPFDSLERDQDRQDYKEEFVQIQIIDKSLHMDNVDLSSYYDKLSEIRAKVLSKNRERPIQSSYKYEKQNIAMSRDYRSTQKREEVSQRRKPLEDKVEKETNIMNRVRDLDTVNEKIKLILASKREPFSTHQRVNSSYQKNPSQISSTPKKMTSLFQNENNIVESKVTSSNKVNNLSDYRSSEVKTTLNQRRYATAKREIKESNYIPQKLQENQPSSFKVQKNNQTFLERERNSESVQRDTFSFNIKQEPLKESSTIQITEKTRPEVNFNKNKTESSKLVSILTKQIQLDSKLRQSKEQFHNFKDQNKLSQLKDTIFSYDSKISEKEIQDWIHMSTEECNPFFQYTQQSVFDYQQFAARLISSWDYWKNEVKESVTISGLEEEGFKIQQIDLGNKGYLTLQDFVCFVNLNSDSCFRNRDAVNMFRRWNHENGKEKGENRLKYETFLNFVAK